MKNVRFSYIDEFIHFDVSELSLKYVQFGVTGIGCILRILLNDLLLYIESLINFGMQTECFHLLRI